MIRYTCQCCGIEREFADSKAAHEAGWDAPPYFTQYISCDICPGVCLVMGASHKKAHQHWTEHGRPTEFNDYCLPDDDFGKEGTLKRTVEEAKKMLGVSGSGK